MIGDMRGRGTALVAGLIEGSRLDRGCGLDHSDGRIGIGNVAGDHAEIDDGGSEAVIARHLSGRRGIGNDHHFEAFLIFSAIASSSSRADCLGYPLGKRKPNVSSAYRGKMCK